MGTEHIRSLSVDYATPVQEVASNLGLINGDSRVQVLLNAWQVQFGGTYRSVGLSCVSCEHVILERTYTSHHDVVSDLLTREGGQVRRPLPFPAMLAAARECPELGTRNIVTSFVAVANTKKLDCCDKARHIMCLAPKDGGRVLRCVTFDELHARGTGYLVLDL